MNHDLGWATVDIQLNNPARYHVMTLDTDMLLVSLMELTQKQSVKLQTQSVVTIHNTGVQVQTLWHAHSVMLKKAESI